MEKMYTGHEGDIVSAYLKLYPRMSRGKGGGGGVLFDAPVVLIKKKVLPIGQECDEAEGVGNANFEGQVMCVNDPKCVMHPKYDSERKRCGRWVMMLWVIGKPSCTTHRGKLIRSVLPRGI